MQPQKFLVELIKPSHYDDDGYVIQSWRGWVPSNSLSCLYGLASDSSARRVLGPDVDIHVTAYDETNQIVPLRKIIRRFRRNSMAGLVCLVGVQSNQFPRAMDLACVLRRHGLAVIIGGFHVSGCISMLPEMPPSSKRRSILGSRSSPERRKVASTGFSRQRRATAPAAVQFCTGLAST